MSTVRALADVLRYRECIALLVVRTLKVRYRRSILGFAWTLVYPLLAMSVLSVVFSHVFTSVTNYPLYVIVGVLAWSFFSISCVQAMDSLLTSGAILKKVRVPGAVFPVAAVGANFVNYVLALVVLVVASVACGVAPKPHPLWLLTGLVSLGAFSLGIALALAALNLFFHDVRYLFETMLLVWFYATPIVYPAAVLSPDAAMLLRLNPMYWFMELLRASLWSGGEPVPGAAILAPLIALATFSCGWLVFTRLERRFYLYL